jgi:Tfp pilus assembly protein PilO
MRRPSPPIRDFNAPTIPAWPRLLLLFAGLVLVAFIGWTVYTHSEVGQCHGQEREVAEFRFGVNLKQMMNLPVLEEDRERFDDLCRMFQAHCYRLLDADTRAICRPI